MAEGIQQPVPYDTSAAWICCIQDGGVALWNAITDVAGDRHALLLASRTRQRETSTQQLYVPCPWQGDGRAEPATEERGEEGQR